MWTLGKAITDGPNQKSLSTGARIGGIAGAGPGRGCPWSDSRRTTDPSIHAKRLTSQLIWSLRSSHTLAGSSGTGSGRRTSTASSGPPSRSPPAEAPHYRATHGANCQLVGPYPSLRTLRRRCPSDRGDFSTWPDRLYKTPSEASLGPPSSRTVISKPQRMIGHQGQAHSGTRALSDQPPPSAAPRSDRLATPKWVVRQGVC